MKKNIRKYRKRWRKYGALICLIIMLAFLPFSFAYYVVGGVCILMLTVPCGVKQINTIKALWYIRQLCFLSLGIFNIMAKLLS